MIPKFRAWDKKNQRWMTKEIEDSEESEIRLDLWGNVEFKPPWWEQGADSVYRVDGSEMFDIMQSTGLKDTNGVEIFEGDILNFVTTEFNGSYFDTEHTGKVEFSDGAYFVGIYFLGEVLLDDVEAEIIGNIYENPELLEVAEWT